MDELLDARVRQAAFDFLAEQTLVFGRELPRMILQQGFEFEGVRVPLMGPQGIFKPALLELPLSITTVPEVMGKERQYEDEIDAEGRVLHYRYRGSDPQHRDNVGLRRAMEGQLPLIYLFGLVPNLYTAIWPVYVIGDDPSRLTFVVEERSVLTSSASTAGEDARAYASRPVRQRLHQLAFRRRVIWAYRETCSVCRLKHPELLDAAHILPDTHPEGRPIVQNGLSLCKLHHAAFDTNILGVRPDHVIELRQDVLDEVDGPMLVHGLQGFQGSKLILPRSKDLNPHSVFLEERYDVFRMAG